MLGQTMLARVSHHFLRSPVHQRTDTNGAAGPVKSLQDRTLRILFAAKAGEICGAPELVREGPNLTDLATKHSFGDRLTKQVYAVQIYHRCHFNRIGSDSPNLNSVTLLNRLNDTESLRRQSTGVYGNYGDLRGDLPDEVNNHQPFALETGKQGEGISKFFKG